jgi:uncharacterized protein (TIGR02145 family)
LDTGKTYYVRAYIREGDDIIYGDLKKVDPRSCFTDVRDNRIYGTVQIGDQTWMRENLNYHSLSGSWVYNNDISSEIIYGRLYDWHTAVNAAPQGWRLPSKSDWDGLLAYLGGSGRIAYERLITGGDSGMNVFFGGFSNDNVEFFNTGKAAYFWSATEIDSNRAACLFVVSDTSAAYTGQFIKTSSFSLRSVKD